MVAWVVYGVEFPLLTVPIYNFCCLQCLPFLLLQLLLTMFTITVAYSV